METRPKLKIEPTFTEKILEIAGWTILAFTWCLVIFHFRDLPDTIPTHYNASGNPDGYGNKNSILLLPIISAILYIGMTTLNKYPHILNYPTNLTPANALRHYTSATRIIRYLKTCVVLIFAAIVFLTYLTTKGKTSGLGTWFLPMALASLIIPAIYTVVKSYKSPK